MEEPRLGTALGSPGLGGVWVTMHCWAGEQLLLGSSNHDEMN